MNTKIYPFLSGGGYIGSVMREKNWGETILGDPNLWPSCLKNTMSLLLNSKSPMLFWWGPQSLQFYNDAFYSGLVDDINFASPGLPGFEYFTHQWSSLSKALELVALSGEGYSVDDIPDSDLITGIKSLNWIQSLNPIKDECGLHQGVLVICSQVPNQSKASQKTQESQYQLLDIFEDSTVGIAIIERDDLTFSMANSFYGSLVGREPSSLIGKPLLDALPELADQGFDKLLYQVIATAVPYIAREVQVEIRKNETLEKIFVDFSYQPRRDLNNEVFSVLVVVTDVTPQVISRKKIEDNERILLNMILNAPIGVGLLNAGDFVTEIINDSFVEIAGKSYEQIIGKNYWIPFAEAAPYYQEPLNNVVKYATPFFANEVPMMLIRHGKEENIFVTFAYMPLKDTTGIVKKIAVWVLENTHQVIERRKVEEIVQLRTNELSLVNIELKESNELLVKSNDSLERFAYVASHDLQEPLRKIQQFGELLIRMKSSDNNQEAKYLERIMAATERMSSLIRDLLDFSKISHQRAVLVPTSLNKVVNQVLVTLERVISESQAVVNVEKLPEILADPMQMDQLFQNLLSNALKYKKPGQSPVISVGYTKVFHAELPEAVMPARQAAEYLRIDVQDNGIGFDETQLSRIFQIFQRLHGKNEFAGTGIGLAIAEKVAVNHGGALTASSQIDVGSTFCVYFPVPEA